MVGCLVATPKALDVAADDAYRPVPATECVNPGVLRSPKNLVRAVLASCKTRDAEPGVGRTAAPAPRDAPTLAAEGGMCIALVPGAKWDWACRPVCDMADRLVPTPFDAISIVLSGRDVAVYDVCWRASLFERW